jgi:hypothetical protein
MMTGLSFASIRTLRTDRRRSAVLSSRDECAGPEEAGASHFS